MHAEIDVEVIGGVATLMLDAPDRRNALTVDMARGMIAACDELDADPTVGAVVITGAGPYFCSGGDRPTLAAAAEDPAHPERYARITAIYGAFTRIGELEAPTIAAVRGGAVGAGLNLALAADLRVGLHPGGGHSHLLTRAGARETAAALQLFGQRIDGVRAAAVGMAYAAVQDDEVLATALEIASVAGADPELARRTARSFRTIAGPPALPWSAAVGFERASQMWSMRRGALARTKRPSP
jgi:enoyl-CoA hydratase